MWTSGTWWEAVRQMWEVLSIDSLISLVLATHRHPKICWNSIQMLNNVEKISDPVHFMKLNHPIIAEILCLHKVCYRLASDRKTHHKYFVATCTPLNWIKSHPQPVQQQQRYTYCKLLGNATRWNPWKSRLTYHCESLTNKQTIILAQYLFVIKYTCMYQHYP